MHYYINSLTIISVYFYIPGMFLARIVVKITKKQGKTNSQKIKEKKKKEKTITKGRKVKGFHIDNAKTHTLEVLHTTHYTHK